MKKKILTKPDGRRQILYSLRPISDNIKAPSPEKDAIRRSGHLRFNPFLGEWNIYSPSRQTRTFMPPPEYNPLAPMTDPSIPTEVPEGDYDVTVFENLFPSLGIEPDLTESIVPLDRAAGGAEVVVYTKDPHSSLGALPLSQVELIIKVWADRYVDLGSRNDVQYVFCFENRGEEVGVTLQHPHGQIYAYPFVPPIASRQLANQRAYYEKNRRGLLADHIQKELQDAKRIIYSGEHAVAFMPAFARYAYEVWIAPIKGRPSLASLSKEETKDLARALKTILMKFDCLWERPFPYIMAWHQAPTDGREHPEAHAHAEFYPPYRMKGRLKYLAGSEAGMGVFTADTYPEEKAQELQKVIVRIEDA